MQQLCGQVQGRELRVQKIKPRLHDRLSKSFLTNVYSRTMSTPLNDNYVLQIEWLPEISKGSFLMSLHVRVLIQHQ